MNNENDLGVPLRVGLSGSTLRSGPEDGTSPTIPHAKETRWGVFTQSDTHVFDGDTMERCLKWWRKNKQPNTDYYAFDRIADREFDMADVDALWANGRPDTFYIME